MLPDTNAKTLPGKSTAIAVYPIAARYCNVLLSSHVCEVKLEPCNNNMSPLLLETLGCTAFLVKILQLYIFQ